MSVVWFVPSNTPPSLAKTGFPGSTVIAARLVQRKNGASPMLVTLLGIVTLVRLVALNAASPRVVTVPGVVMLVSGHNANTDSPMLVTPSDIVTLTRLVQ